ncbi:TauD/TfdA dioxygenase family protein [Nocardia vaccinii]|uniref:TauD/TfdA dioxygenase family protein n=1 Tax=Nocardia vaccinii TaxID=1822 RepID=UPI00082DC966|nr:TauD/TfdA family dioxygenase [Nocardia vaccinii]
MGHTVSELTPTTGVEFTGVPGGDLLDEEIAAQTLDALERRGVAVFREAHATDDLGRSPAEGRALLDRLLEWSTQPRYVVRHTWRVGDLVIWDNTGMLHRALPYGPESARLMHRASLAGREAVA